MTAKPGTVRVRGKAEAVPDLTDSIIARLTAAAPRAEGSRNCTFEVTRSSVEILSKVRYILKTGIEPYDVATGIGGLPFGRVVEIYGLDGACKSAMVQRLAVRLQQGEIYALERDGDGKIAGNRRLIPGAPTGLPTDPAVFTIYIDNEQALDDDGKTKIDGVELDMALARCDTVDQMFKIIDTAIDGVDEWSRKHNDVECFILVIVDTIAGTSSREEINAKWEDVDYPRQPRQLREGFRVMMRKINRRNVLMVCTNQVSDSYKQKTKSYGNSLIPQDGDFNTFGGRALKYYASLRIFQFRLNTQYRLSRGIMNPSGMTVGFQVTKNRLGKPWRTGRLVLLYQGGISNVFSLLETLVHMKFAERDDDGIMFRFHGIATTTFPPPKPGTRPRNPRIGESAEWPAFYEAHKTDFDLLWERAKDLMFSDNVVEESDAEDDLALVEE
jgi:recombination protein RecA